jgi:protoporphyrin/coproporphyrin ferrochelatase
MHDTDIIVMQWNSNSFGTFVRSFGTAASQRLPSRKGLLSLRSLSKDAVLLLAHGTPEVLGEMEEYLKLVTGGRGVPPHVVHELRERYAAIGLRDTPSAEGPHLTRWTMRQADRLRERLDCPVYVGMRNWKPFIQDVVDDMRLARIERVRAICLAPQNSRTSVGLFKRAVEDAVAGSFSVDFVAGWADHPMLIKAFAQRMQAALNAARSKGHGRVAVLFTAHSVPTRTIQSSEAPVEYHGMILANGPDSYADDCKETARLVAKELRDILDPYDWYFAFQSQGMSGGPWIGPTVEDTLSQLKADGYETVVIQPIGFLCDHVEVLYDIDIAFQETAQSLGLKLIRTESLNDSSLLTDALEDLALYGKDYSASNSSSSADADFGKLPRQPIAEIPMGNRSLAIVEASRGE